MALFRKQKLVLVASALCALVWGGKMWGGEGDIRTADYDQSQHYTDVQAMLTDRNVTLPQQNDCGGGAQSITSITARINPANTNENYKSCVAYEGNNLAAIMAYYNFPCKHVASIAWCITHSQHNNNDQQKRLRDACLEYVIQKEPDVHTWHIHTGASSNIPHDGIPRTMLQENNFKYVPTNIGRAPSTWQRNGSKPCGCPTAATSEENSNPRIQPSSAPSLLSRLPSPYATAGVLGAVIFVVTAVVLLERTFFCSVASRTQA